MPYVPAICSSCGTLFSSGIFVENVLRLRLGNNTAGPCPVCGDTGKVIEGIFDFIGDSIRILSASRHSVETLRALRVSVQDAGHEQRPPEEVAAAVTEAVPELGPLVQRLLVPRTPGQFYTLLGVLVSVITLVLTLKQGPESTTNINIERQVIRVVEECVRSPRQKSPSHLPTDPEQETRHNNETGEPDP